MSVVAAGASGDTVACVVPAYEAATTLGAVLLGLRRALPATWLAVVDDGSSDDTAAVAAPLASVVVRHATNRGKGAALRSGFREALAAGATVIVTLDADGQHDPEYAPSLVSALRHADLVLGARTRAPCMPIARRATNALASAAARRLTGMVLPDTQSGYRAMVRSLVERIEARGDGYEFETDFLFRAARAGCRIASVPVPTRYGAHSHFRPIADGVSVVRTFWAHRRPAARVR